MSSVEPRPASTVVLLRNVPKGIETFLLRRATTMAFAPRMHVFPGGQLDEVDFDVPLPLTPEQVDELARRSSADVELAQALYACAVRETAEEANVVTDSLILFDHWVTPERESRRYDVRFFMAALPHGQAASLVTTEAVHAEWISPADALVRFESGDLPMLAPTVAVLRYLAAFANVDAAIADGAQRDVVPQLPHRDADGTWRLLHAYTRDVIDIEVDGPLLREDSGLPRDPE